MEQEKIKQLLERYWQCETSPEEEQRLQEFFSGTAIPEELKAYKPLFAWKNRQKAITAKYRPLLPQKPLIRYFYPALKIAASVLLVLAFGIGVYTYYQQEKWIDRIFSESATESLDAVKDSTEVVAKASMRRLPEDSSQHVQPLLKKIVE